MSFVVFRNVVEKCLLRSQYSSYALAGQSCLQNSFHSVVSPLTGQGTLASGSSGGNIASTSWSLVSIRTNVRNHFPRPSEKKRLKLSFWNRMKTPGGRAVIMRRYLKGRHVLAH